MKKSKIKKFKKVNIIIITLSVIAGIVVNYFATSERIKNLGGLNFNIRYVVASIMLFLIAFLGLYSWLYLIIVIVRVLREEE